MLHVIRIDAPIAALVSNRCQDTSDPGHFGPKIFWHYQTGAEVSGQFGTSAEVSFGYFGTGAELPRASMLMMMESPIGTTYELRPSSVDCVSSCGR